MNKQSQKKIGWCDATVNAVGGCTFGCPFCYAERMNQRFHYVDDFSKPQFFPERLEQLNCKKSKIIFMDSMSDIADWKSEWMAEVFNAIIQNQQHRYIFLSKRPMAYHHPMWDELYEVVGDIAWIGTSICRRGEEHRAFQLYRSHNFLNSQFISFEPIQGPFDPNCADGLKWAILGVETGQRKDKFIPTRDGILYLVYALRNIGIPVFMKDSCLPIVGEENMLRQFPERLRRGAR